MTQLERSAQTTAEVLRRIGDDATKFTTVVENLKVDVLAVLLSHCDDEDLKNRVQEHLSAEKLVEVLNRSTGDVVTATNATVPSAPPKVEKTSTKKQEITLQEKELGLNIQNSLERTVSCP